MTEAHYSDKEAAAIGLARKAATLREDPMWQHLMGEYLEGLFRAFKKADPGDVKAIQHIAYQARALKVVQDYLTGIENAGKVADRTAQERAQSASDHRRRNEP